MNRCTPPVRMALLHSSSSDGIDSEHAEEPAAAAWKNIECRDSAHAAILHLSGILFPVHKFHNILYGTLLRWPYYVSRVPYYRRFPDLCFFLRNLR